MSLLLLNIVVRLHHQFQPIGRLVVGSSCHINENSRSHSDSHNRTRRVDLVEILRLSSIGRICGVGGTTIGG